MAALAEWVAVDWGTSNVRAWGIGADGEVVFSRASPEGMSRLTREQYPSVLAGLVAEEVGTEADVLICGMAGARQGWREAPYMDAPADLRTLAGSAVEPEMDGAQLRALILPGVCQRDRGAEDVMRGEETQLLGLTLLSPGYSGLAILPGTHSKWAMLEGTTLTRFGTAMTGEVFEVLKTHSVLRHSLGGELEGPERDEGFEAGLDSGLSEPQRLTAMLFKVRAGSLLSGNSPPWSAGFLSGLLIGAEIAGQKSWIGNGEIALIGSVGLASLYARALGRLGVATRIVDAAEATLAGLRAARQG